MATKLPPRMVTRTYTNKSGQVWTGYYYQHPRDAQGKRKLTSLGDDLAAAKVKWAELEKRTAPADLTTIAGVYAAWLEWTKDKTLCDLAPRTIADRVKYWAQLKRIYADVPINALVPGHILPYFEARSSKVSAKKELKFLSVLCNWARGKGLMRVPNPCTGLFVQMKAREGRDIYVEDMWLALVYKHGSDVIRDALDLAYLTGQRPADVKGLRWSQVKDGVLQIGQNKTGAKLRIIIEGQLAVVLDRIRARGIKGLTILADPTGQPLKEFGYFRSQFDKARDLAEQEAAELGIEFVRFQFRDLRPKAATDLDSLHSLKAAQKLLGHTTERMTADYIRKRRGDVVQPVPMKKVK